MISHAAKQLIACSLCAFATAFAHAEGGVEVPESAEITEADQQAVERLGDTINHSLVTDVRDLVADTVDMSGAVQEMSGEAIDLKTSEAELKQAIADLDGEVRGNELYIKMSSDILFDFDKADLRPEAQTELIKAASIIQARAQGTVSIHGHTDAKGSDEYNEKLSIKRAQTVHQWLSEVAQLSTPFQIIGHGESEPAAPNTNPDGSDNPEGRAKNRRVEISMELEQNW